MPCRSSAAEKAPNRLIGGVPCQWPTFGYGLPVKFSRMGGHRMAAALLISFSTWLSADVIHLRNERIDTEGRPAKAAVARQSDQAQAPALFLVQFTGPVRPEWRTAFNRIGVELLRYVPNNAFVVRAKGPALRLAAGMPFVRWTGPYRASHKIHRGLQAKGGAGAMLSVRILVAPGAAAA